MFNDNVQRIIELNGFDIDIEPKGKMIFMKNNDVPGVIGTVGKLLGDNNVNISDFRLARGKDNKALAVILVDELVSHELLQKIDNLEAAISVSYAEI